MIELIPAYGRDYKSAEDVKADWAAGKDFRVATFGPDDGRYANNADIKEPVLIRYNALRKIVTISPT